MRDIQISRPVVIALIGAVLVGGFLLFRQSQSEETAPPPPAPTTAAATGATGATGASGETGATGPTMTAKERREQRAKERRAELKKAAYEAGMPLSAYKPLSEGKIVMVLFYTNRGQVDDHVRQSVDEIVKKRGKQLHVIRESVKRKSRYDGVAKVADITQTPGVLLLYGDEADTWQGYIDAVALNARISRLVGSD